MTLVVEGESYNGPRDRRKRGFLQTILVIKREKKGNFYII
jgi:hypothetical protein